MAEQTGIIERRGAWYRYQGENFAQGRENVLSQLSQHTMTAVNIEQQIKQKLTIIET